jgi:hypothetical protein
MIVANSPRRQRFPTNRTIIRAGISVTAGFDLAQCSTEFHSTKEEHATGLEEPPLHQDRAAHRGGRPRGYARVSTIDQDTALQVAALTAAGCGVIREEKASGTTTDGRTELATCTEQPVNTGIAAGKAFLDSLACSLSSIK